MSTPTPARYDWYVAAIVKACRRPGTRAALRSGLGRSVEQASRMHPVVAGLIPRDDWNRPDRERAYYTIAALLAAQPRVTREQPDTTEDSAEAPTPSLRGNFGHSLAQAVSADRRRRDEPSSHPLARRLHLLVRQDVNGVHRHLPGLVRQLRTDQIPIDWAHLLEDLLHWRTGRDRIARRWLQTYYRQLAPQPATDDASPQE